MITTQGFVIQDEGTLVLIHAMSFAAADWVTENVSPEGYQPSFPDTLIVEARYADALLVGILDAGFEVEARQRTMQERHPIDREAARKGFAE